MTLRLKWLLIIAPVVLVLALFQSVFWVPTYEAQTTGNPARLEKFIEASIGDAKILNPILNADTASSGIVDKVFEGLLDLDENLNLRGRLATDWTVTETAYLAVNPRAYFPDGSPVTTGELETRIRRAVTDGTLNSLQDNLIDIRLQPAHERTESISLRSEDDTAISVTVDLHVPERVEFRLRKVDQDFFKRLEVIIGDDYASSAPYDSWIEVEPTNKRNLVAPRFAELLPVFEHNPIIRFNLRNGVHFHDGHEFDAGDVKFTYEAIMDPKNLSPRTSDFEPIKSVRIIAPHVVEVIYKRLFSPAINAWSMGILPEHLLNEDAMRQEMDRRGLSETAREAFGMRDSEFNRKPIGFGPFKFVKWQSDEMIHLTRNDDYWEGPPLYKDYFYRIIPDALTQEVEFRTGAIDTYGTLPHQVARYTDDPAYQSYSSLGLGFTYIGYSNRHPILKDKRVRRALGMAVNVDEIIKYVLYGEGERITGPYPKNTQWYDATVLPLPYDPMAAEALLGEAGWRKNADGWLEKDGQLLEFNLITNNGNLVRKAVLTIAQNNWRKIGIKCNTQLFEWAVLLKDFINPGKFDAVVLGWSMGVDPDLYQIWHSSESGPNQLNFVGYNNPVADDLIVRIRREYDVATQRELTHRLHAVIADDQPYSFLFAPRGTRVLDKKIVMVDEEGKLSRLKQTKTGSIFFYFNRWKKLEHAVEL